MKASFEMKDNYSITVVPDESSKIVVAHITADLHSGGTVETEYAPWLLLPDALKSGCDTLTREQFLDKLNLLGASIDITSVNRFVSIEIRSTSEVFQKVLSLLSLMVLKPTFAPNELKRIKGTVTNELEDARENSKFFADANLRNTLWHKQDRRYTPLIDESLQYVASLTKKQLESALLGFRNSHWKCTIGGTTADIKKFERVVRTLQGAPLKSSEKLHERNKKPQALVLEDIPSRQNIDFSIGSVIPITRDQEDFPALTMAIAILGKVGGFTGRLMSTVREQEGLTYGIYANSETFFAGETGQWRIFTFFAPDKAVQGLSSTFREVKQLYDKGVTEAELQKFKRILETGEVLSHDSLVRYTQLMHAYHVQGQTLEEIEAFRKKRAQLTVKEVNAAIQKYLNPTQLTISAAGPVAAVKSKIKEFSAQNSQ